MKSVFEELCWMSSLCGEEVLVVERCPISLALLPPIELVMDTPAQLQFFKLLVPGHVTSAPLLLS